MTTHAAPCAAQGASRARGGWQASAGIEEAFYGRVQSADSTIGGGASVRVRVEAARVWQSSRDNLAITARGSLVRFIKQEQLDQNAYDLSASASRQFTRRLLASAAYVARTDFIDRTISGIGGGQTGSAPGSVPLAGVVPARSSSASARLGYSHSPTLTSRVAVSSQRIAVIGNQDADGRLYEMSAGLAAVAGRKSTLGAELVYGRSAVGRSAFDIPQLSLSSQHRLTKRVELRLKAGSVVAGVLVKSPLSSMSGGAGIAISSVNGSVSFDANRVIGQLFGTGITTVQATNGISMTVSKRLEGGLNIDVRAAQTRSDALSADAFAFGSSELSLAARYAPRIGPVFSLTAFAARRTDGNAVVNSGLTAGFDYRW